MLRCLAMENDARSLDQKTQAQLRHRAHILHKKVKSRLEISDVLGVHIKTIDRWRSDFRHQGAAALRPKKRGRQEGSDRSLTPEQEVEVQKKITEKTPDQLKMNFALWTRRAVCELIKHEYGLSMPVRTCGEYLKRWGFTPQKPAKRAYEQDPPAVARWLEETYPAIANEAKSQNAEIHWGDETGVRNDCQHGRGYAPKGQTPILRKKAKRFSTNMISSVTNQGKVRWMIYRETLTSQVFIRFMERLIKDSKKKVFLIVDNLRVHHSAPVKEWVEANKKCIALFHLPSYSPEHNPDEYLNGDLKSELGRKAPPMNQQHLEKNLIGSMRQLSKSPQRIASYFNHPAVAYAKAA
jgi:transposase